MATSSAIAGAVRLFDAHCHLQDPRIAASVLPQVISTALDSGVRRFVVNGVSERDWHAVKEMGVGYESVIPCFGLHPWFILERSSNWFSSLKQYMSETPTAAIGETGLDKGSHGKSIDFSEQVLVFRDQLELAKELKKPISVHCVRAYGELLDIMTQIGPFPAGVIMHSYMGSAEMIPGFGKLGCYFSFSGFLMSMKPQKAKKVVKSVPLERILIETDAPDALPTVDTDLLLPVPNVTSPEQQLNDADDSTVEPKPTKPANHPANIHIILKYVAALLEMPQEELAEVSFRNATRLFAYPGSKVYTED